MGYYDLMGDDDDLLGDVDVLGDDDDLGYEDDILGAAFDILGARKRKKSSPLSRGRSRGRGGAAKRLAASRGTVVRSTGPSAARRLTMGVDSGAVAANTAATITIQPVEPFRTELFAVDPTVAPSFSITGILVGRKSQLVGTAAINAAMFSAGNPLCAVQWDTAQTSQPISIAILNLTGGALRFMGALFGTAVDMG